MIVVEYKNGQKEVIAGETYADFDLMNRHGKIMATMVQGGQSNGHQKVIFREDVRAVEMFPKAEWDKLVEEEKKNKAKQEADQAAAKQKALDNQARVRAEAEAKAAFEAGKFGNRIKRLFKRG